MSIIDLVFVIAALVVFIIATFAVTFTRVSLIAAGLALLTLGAFVLPALHV